MIMLLLSEEQYVNPEVVGSVWELTRVVQFSTHNGNHVPQNKLKIKVMAICRNVMK